MRKDRIEERSRRVEELVGRVLGHIESELPPPLPLYEELVRLLSPGHGGSTLDYGDAVVGCAMQLVGAGRFCEALTLVEQALHKCPEDLQLQSHFESLLARLAQELEQLGAREPSASEFGRTYERLLEFGNIPIRGHLHAVDHYRLCGNLERAASIAIRLRRVAPHLPGLAGAVRKLAEVSDDAAILALQSSIMKEED
jgi:hypothetical protein